ncbi:hypothetical protein ACFLQU_02835 [Verrucomicrobiota bacterium]
MEPDTEITTPKHATRWRVPAFYAVLALLALTALFQRLPGFNPPSLWLDDLWLAALTKHASLRYLLFGSAPCPPAFGLLLRCFTALAGHGHWQFQVLPLVAALAYVVLAGHFVFALTRRMSLGLLATVFAAANPTLAIYSLRAKPYSFDVLAAQLLLMGTFVCWRRQTLRSIVLLTAGCMLAMLFSFPSILVGAALVNIVALTMLLQPDNRPKWRPSAVTLAACNVALLVTYLVMMRPHVSGAGRGPLSNFYPTATTAPAIAEFVWENGAAFFWGAFPARITWIALFVPVGLYAMIRKPEWRGVGLAVTAFYLGIFLASLLRIYPLGAGRTDAFSYPFTITAAALGIDLLTRKYKFFAVGGAVFVLAVFGFELATVRYTYPESGARAVVERVSDAVQADDALVVYPCSNWPLALYGKWPTELVVMKEPVTGFYMYPERPRTLVINEVIDGVWYAHDARIVKQQLEPFLLKAHERLVYMASSAHEHVNAWIVECITSHGYIVQVSETYPTSYFMIFVRE